MQAVSESEGSFTSRLPLPVEWRGLRDQALSDVADIPGCVFVRKYFFLRRIVVLVVLLLLLFVTLSLLTFFVSFTGHIRRLSVCVVLLLGV